MKILSLDTSSRICSVAILEDMQPIYEQNIDDEKSHSQNLMPMIKKAFESTNLSLHDIDLFCVSKGPGSFTGIRIGISTIKAFVDVLEKKVIGVSSLEGLAYHVKDKDYVCSLIDANNDQVYYGLFQYQDNQYHLVGEYLAEHIDYIIQTLKLHSIETITFVGNGAVIHHDKIIQNFGGQAQFAPTKCNDSSAVGIGIAGFLKYGSGFYEDSSSLCPLYLRKSRC